MLKCKVQFTDENRSLGHSRKVNFEERIIHRISTVAFEAGRGGCGLNEHSINHEASEGSLTALFWSVHETGENRGNI